MIYDQIKYLSELPLSKNVCSKIIAFLENAHNLSAGKYEIDGKSVFASIFCYTTGTAKKDVFESHRKYADLQLVLRGEEQIGITQSDNLQENAPYDADGDTILYNPSTTQYSKVLLFPGYFALLLPRDIHMPGIASQIPCPVIKVVIKIAIELINVQ